MFNHNMARDTYRILSPSPQKRIDNKGEKRRAFLFKCFFAKSLANFVQLNCGNDIGCLHTLQHTLVETTKTDLQSIEMNHKYVNNWENVDSAINEVFLTLTF